MSGEIVIAGNQHMKTLHNCSGYYQCPKGPNGRRLGPLVGYAGKYPGPDGKSLQFVGDIYANFARAEIHPKILRFFAGCLTTRLETEIGLDNIGGFVGTPIGGYSLADALSLYVVDLDIDVIKAEKKVVELATESSREKSKLAFVRHDVERGRSYVIVEDVCNNFSTTLELINLIGAAGGNVLAIVCFLNRSLVVDGIFAPVIGHGLPCWPVISMVRQPIPEYRQDDPAVADDIAKGNVVWKPKDEWPRLMKAMADCQPEHGAGE